MAKRHALLRHAPCVFPQDTVAALERFRLGAINGDYPLVRDRFPYEGSRDVLTADRQLTDHAQVALLHNGHLSRPRADLNQYNGTHLGILSELNLGTVPHGKWNRTDTGDAQSRTLHHSDEILNECFRGRANE